MSEPKNSIHKNHTAPIIATVGVGLITLGGNGLVAHADTLTSTPSVAPTSVTTSNSVSAYDSASTSVASSLADLSASQSANESSAASSYASQEDTYSASASQAIDSAQATHDQSITSASASQQATINSQSQVNQANQIAASQSASEALSSASASYTSQESSAASSYAQVASQTASDNAEKEAQKSVADSQAEAQKLAGSASSDQNTSSLDSQHQSDLASASSAYAQSQASYASVASVASNSASVNYSNAVSNAETQASQAQSDATSSAQVALDSQQATENAQELANEQADKATTLADDQTAISNAQTGLEVATDVAQQQETEAPQINDSKYYLVTKTAQLPTSLDSADKVLAYQNANDTTKIFKQQSDFTESDTEELAGYVLALVNSWREQQGKQDLLWTKQDQLAESKLIAYRIANNIGVSTFSHTGFPTDVENDFATQGLFWDEENMSGNDLSTSDSSVSMLELKTDLYNAVWSMIYDDASSNWGHTANFLNGNHFAMGIQYNPSNVWPVTVVYDMSDPQADASSFTVINNTSITQINDAVVKAVASNTNVVNANATLASAKAKLSTDTTTIDTTNSQAYQALQVTHQQQQANLLSTLSSQFQQIADNLATTKASLLSSFTQETSQIESILSSNLSELQQAYDKQVASLNEAYEVAKSQIDDETYSQIVTRHQSEEATLASTDASALAKLQVQQETELTALKNLHASQLADLASQQQASLTALKEADDALLSKVTRIANGQYASQIKTSDSQLQSVKDKYANGLANLKAVHIKALASIVDADRRAYSLDQTKANAYLALLKEAETGSSSNKDHLAPAKSGGHSTQTSQNKGQSNKLHHNLTVYTHRNKRSYFGARTRVYAAERHTQKSLYQGHLVKGKGKAYFGHHELMDAAAKDESMPVLSVILTGLLALLSFGSVHSKLRKN